MNAVILKVGLYTPKQQWWKSTLLEIPSLMAQHIDEPTGMYLSLIYPTEGNAYRFQPLWDFDDKVDPRRALNDARRFVFSLTKKGIPYNALLPFASGRKGIHIAGGHLLPPRDDWFEIFAHAALRIWVPEFPTLDAGIYKNRALLRAPWSRYAAVNARKKPLPSDLFWRGEWAEIEAWAREPLNDAQYADIEELIRECLPTASELPAYWVPFADNLVLDFRQQALTQKAIAAAKFFRPKRRFKGDWAALLDEAGIDYRERRNKDGAFFKLRACPYCHRSDKAYVTKSGALRCFRTGCEAHDGIPSHVWAEYLGVHLDEESDESPLYPPFTKERARELFEQYEGSDAQLIQGRCEENCQDYERVAIVGSKGYLPGKSGVSRLSLLSQERKS